MGWFITFEGLDGAGKSTQIVRLMDRLGRAGFPVMSTREPGGTRTGDEIRSLLLHPESQVHPFAEVLLYAASRAQLVQEVIRPALVRGEVVLCDRYVDASLAYQGAGLGLGVEAVSEVNRFATGGLQPGLTFLFDLPVETSQSRVHQTRLNALPDRIERRSSAYFEVVRRQFLAIAEEEPERVTVIDASLAPDVIEQEIWEGISKYLEK